MTLTGCPCPNCQKKTMSHPDHPHAFGHKMFEFVKCRKCGKKYKTELYREWVEKVKAKEAQ